MPAIPRPDPEREPEEPETPEDRQHRFDAAWARWFAANPDVLAVWGHQNGYWPHED